jgi:uncharacterized protein (DUF302 family)
MIKKLARVSSISKKMIDMFTVNIISNQSIETVASNVSVMCDKYGFALLQTYNYHEIVESKGFPIKRKVFIYEICQAKTASLMLTSNPNFAIFMPCKLAVYEQDNKTIISTMDMEIMLSAVKSDETLFQEATSLFNKLKSLMNSLSVNTTS